MKSYLKRVEASGEKVLYAAEIHWIIYTMGFFIIVMGALFAHYGTAAVQGIPGQWSQNMSIPVSYIGIAVIVVGALHLLMAYIKQISTELIITDKRVIAKFGLISTTTFELMLPKVEGANIDQTVLGRILGFGTVMVKGTGGGISPIDHVASPYRFHVNLLDAFDKVKNKGGND